jgi:hypothetical protein
MKKVEKSKMQKFKEQEIKSISSLDVTRGGIILTVNWDGFFNGNLFKGEEDNSSRIDESKVIDEFDKP